MATNLIAGAAACDSVGWQWKEWIGIYPALWLYFLCFRVIKQLMREIPSLWENSPLVNEEALIKLIHHILQWNNGSRQQSSRNQNLIMGGRGCHTCPHSSIWASLQGRQPELLASRHETTGSTEYPPRSKKSCLQTEPESNWTPRSLYHPLCFFVCLKFFI